MADQEQFEFDVRKAVYDQDCQFVRYHDGLMWSRFQTIAVIEGAMLYGLYQMHLGLWEKRSLALVASALVFFACLATLTDRGDTQSHLERIRRFEQGGFEFVHRKWRVFSAVPFLLIAFALLTAVNVLVFISSL